MGAAAATKRLIKGSLVHGGVLRAWARCGPPRLAILRYHSVQEDPRRGANTIGDGIIHSAAVFRRQMELIAQRFSPVTLSEALAFLEGTDALPRRAVVVTFDDGFRDNYEVAGPILNRCGVGAAFYVTVASLGSARPPWFCRLRFAFSSRRTEHWTDPRDGQTRDLSDPLGQSQAFLSACRQCAVLAGEPQQRLVASIEEALGAADLPMTDHLMMDWDQVKKLHEKGHIVGSHTLTHPNLAFLPPDHMVRELAESRRLLEKHLAAPVFHFSYPSPILEPHWNDHTIAASRRIGYKTAVTCVAGAAERGSNVLCLPRIVVPQSTEELRWVLEKTLAGG